jgi:hypothetical protein
MKALAASLRKLEPRWPFFALLYGGLVMVHVIDLHMYLRGSPDFRRWHAWHNLIIHGAGPYPDQYRPLSYWLAELVYRIWLNVPWAGAKTAYELSTTFEYSHLLVRFLFLLLSLFLLHLYLRRWFASPACAAAVIFMAAVLPLTVIRCSICVTDPFNLLVFVVGYWLIRDGKGAWLPLLVFIGMINRETAGMLFFAYVFVSVGKPAREWLPTAGYTLVAAAAAYFGIRAYYGQHVNWAPTSPAHYFASNFLDWRTWELILLLVGAWAFWAFVGLRSKPVFLRRCLLMLLLLFAGHASSGYIREVRYWLPALPVLLPLAMWSVWGPERQGIGNRE